LTGLAGCSPRRGAVRPGDQRPGRRPSGGGGSGKRPVPKSTGVRCGRESITRRRLIDVNLVIRDFVMKIDREITGGVKFGGENKNEGK
jgi:hypothetical protein